jgi:hypothetical protein
VQELTRLHGGSVTVESEYGKGSTFRVSILAGTSHLPQQQIGGMRTQASTGLGAQPFVEEALRWLPGEVQNAIIDDALPADQRAIPEAERPLILLADDNADMREHLARLLSAHYRIEAVADGEAALRAARASGSRGRPPEDRTRAGRSDGGLARQRRAIPRVYYCKL